MAKTKKRKYDLSSIIDVKPKQKVKVRFADDLADTIQQAQERPDIKRTWHIT